jgi:hypothetical protein
VDDLIQSIKEMLEGCSEIVSLVGDRIWLGAAPSDQRTFPYIVFITLPTLGSDRTNDQTSIEDVVVRFSLFTKIASQAYRWPGIVERWFNHNIRSPVFSGGRYINIELSVRTVEQEPEPDSDGCSVWQALVDLQFAIQRSL